MVIYVEDYLRHLFDYGAFNLFCKPFTSYFSNLIYFLLMKKNLFEFNDLNTYENHRIILRQ